MSAYVNPVIHSFLRNMLNKLDLSLVKMTSHAPIWFGGSKTVEGICSRILKPRLKRNRNTLIFFKQTSAEELSALGRSQKKKKELSALTRWEEVSRP